MTDKTDHIATLLNQAPSVPASPDLSQQIMTMAVLDSATSVPSSPNLKQNILSAASEQNPTAEIIIFAPPAKRHRLYPTARTSGLMAGGLMAASLMLGIWTGSNGIADNILAAPFELAGLQLSDSTDELSLYNVIDGLTPSENLL